ncbi:hypothetical protein CANARDRAFT_26105 [[Candida] arabinofermentans NRRL YB-2248]|uniref:MHD1 domain-containing protein n=1 Tax=[Candida] arabinofermentans NRRL YB-2248 TaxID=983967 RepID=A0A1E4T840_9ASCO|nr:hypothetical protein CANARDRAFT_26105 [[Candida] arabinofermentans NRRL YB-2248]
MENASASASANENSFFHEYVLEYYLKVQLLVDPKFIPVQVKNIPTIPLEPIISNKKVHLKLGSRNEVLNKQFVETLRSLGSFSDFQLHPATKKYLISFFGKYNHDLKTMEVNKILELFNNLLTPDRSMLFEVYFICRVQIIDILLLMKASSSQQRYLLSQRLNILNESYLPLPNISDDKKRDLICKCFNVSLPYLEGKIKELRGQVNKEDAIRLICSKEESLEYKYTRNDFETYENWNEWISQVKNLNSRLSQRLSAGASTGTPGRSKYKPNDIPKVVSLLNEIMFKSNSQFYQSYLECLELWQVDPFETYILVLKGLFSNSVDLTIANKTYGLAKLTMVIQLDPPMWPTRKRRELYELNSQIFERYKDWLLTLVGNFFDNKKNFTDALQFIQNAGVTEQVHKLVTEKFKSVLESRLQQHRSTLNNNPADLSNLINYLALSLLDFESILSWCTENKDLNQQFRLLTLTKMCFTAPLKSYTETFIYNLHKANTNISDPKVSLNVSSLLEIISKLSEKIDIGSNYQDLLFNDVLKLIKNWEAELVVYCARAVDEDKLKRLDGCAYSSSVQYVLQLCTAYLNILKSFGWKNDLQQAEMYASLYRSIAGVLTGYSNKMLAIITEDLQSTRSLDFKGDSCTCLNNIWKVLHYMDEFNTEELAHYSDLLFQKNQQRSVVSPKKIVSVSIKNAENVEDKRGEPVSLYVILSGAINGRTRCVIKDYNPDWSEQFQTLTSKDLGLLQIRVMEDNGALYKHIAYRLDLKGTGVPTEEKLSLYPNSGDLNVSISIESEKNDPVFYISRSKMEITKGKDRAIKLFVDKFSYQLKSVFSRSYLEQSLSMNPASAFKIELDSAKDQMLTNYIEQMGNVTIDELYDNLETECFDEVILQMWTQTLKYAESLLLPRLSFLFRRIKGKLDKRSSGVSAFMNGSGSKFRKTTDEEFTRVMEWCYRIEAMLHVPDKILEKPLVEPFKNFQKIFELFQLRISDLKSEYATIWGYTNKQILKKYTGKEANPEFKRLNSEKELVLRILLAKNEAKYVKRSIEIEQRYTRAVRTELEYVATCSRIL